MTTLSDTQPAGDQTAPAGSESASSAPASDAVQDASKLFGGGKLEGEKATAGKPEEKKTEAAPEAYEAFSAPQGIELDPELLGEFTPIAKELNLSQANAQRLVDVAAKVISKQFDALTATHAQWAEDARNDATIGGDKLKDNLKLGKRVIDLADSEDGELRAVLNDTGFGNHPALIRAFAKLGALISEDALVRGGAPAAPAKSVADKLYGGGG